MAYTKPGVLITQVQESVSPALVEPDLYAGIVGRPYYVFKPGDITFTGYWNPSAGGKTIPISNAWSATFPNVSGVLQNSSIYVDLVGVSGVLAGQRKHMTFNPASPTDSSKDAWISGTSLIISGVDNPTTYAGSAFRVEVGFSVLRGDLQKAVVFEGGSDIQNAIGPTTVFNELGTALTITTSNSNRKTYAYGIVTNELVGGHNAAQDAFTSKDIYAIAPLTSNWNSKIIDYKVYVESLSLPASKKERVVVACPAVPWRGTAGSTDSTVRENTATDIASRAAITKSKRLVMVHPDVAYLREKLHISKIKQDYLRYNIGDQSEYDMYSTYSLYALLTGNVTLSDGTKYFKDDQITDVVWQNLLDDGYHELTVLIPVPGSHVAAAVAGQISGEKPEQPLTNLAIGGIERIRYSNDHFSDDNLDTMAEGGTYIVVQDQPTLPVACRHQLTTDTTTVESREVSIQKSVDFSAKYLRRNLRGVIGRNNITPQFIKTLTTIIKGVGLQLVKKGVVNDFKLLSLEQDATEKDRIKGKVSILAKYPSNYIEIDLIY